VTKNSPAEEAGLKPDDIILKVKGQETKSIDSVRRILRSLQIGEEIEIEVLRSGESKVLKLKVGSYTGRR